MPSRSGSTPSRWSDRQAWTSLSRGCCSSARASPPTIHSGFTSEHASLEAIGEAGSLLLPRAPWHGEAPAILLDDREIPVPPDDPYRLEVENLSAAILGEAEPLLGRADALGQARTIAALYASAESGTAVAIEP